VVLSPEHHQALNRRRRIVVQYDAHGQLGADFEQWLDFRFNYIDDPDSQIDSVWWDVGAGSWAVYPSEVLPRFEHPGLRLWWEKGIDWTGELINQTRRRGLEVFWNHRVSEVDITPTDELEPGHRLMMDARNPLKQAHPDWVIKTWWWQGMWNYAVAGVREHHLDILRELAELYDLDGIQLDFARHIPCVPVGRQWELRGHVTEFVRMVRRELSHVAHQRGRPFLLAARVPRTVHGCELDGLDITTWAREGLVDILSLGSRSMDVDIEGFARRVAGCDVKLQPCFDDHHASDGYRYAPIEYLRGVFGNWWQQGADSVMTFNWPNAPSEEYQRVVGDLWGRGAFNGPGPDSHGQAYREVGSPTTLAAKDKVFAVERRGGYPWAEGFFNRNDDAPLPATPRNDGEPTDLRVRLGDPIRAEADAVKELFMRVVLFGAREGDEFEATLNGVPLPLIARDDAHKDPQIFSPRPQPASGGDGHYAVDPEQKLLCLDFSVDPHLCRLGVNEASVRIVDRAPYVVTDIVLEKLQVHLSYHPQDEGGRS